MDIRAKLQGWKTAIASISTISAAWVAFLNEAITLEAAITATVAGILAMTIGAKIDRAAK